MNVLSMPDAAFAPFFTDTLAFEASRPDGVHRGSVKSCIFDEGPADTFDPETATSSAIGRLAFSVRHRDWQAAMATPPQPGDRFTSPVSGRVYALVRVGILAGCTYNLEAREVSP